MRFLENEIKLHLKYFILTKLKKSWEIEVNIYVDFNQTRENVEKVIAKP